MSKKIFDELQSLLTEKRNPKTKEIDKLSPKEILHLINEEDKKVLRAVRKAIPDIEKVVRIYVETIRGGGRVFYVGAGTSGRLGVLDAAELPPTFGTPYWMVQGIIAGGYGALLRALEGAEDNKEYGELDLKERGVCSKDFVIGLAASKRTPYVLGALNYARKVGARTALITAIPKKEIEFRVDVIVSAVVGPEVIMGSTRMKAGTAEKLILNMISTTSMIMLGKVYENMMVDLMATSKKLEERSKRTIMIVTGVDYDEAERILKEAGGSVKKAICMIMASCDSKKAESALLKAGGFLREALRILTEKK